MHARTQFMFCEYLFMPEIVTPKSSIGFVFDPSNFPNSQA